MQNIDRYYRLSWLILECKYCYYCRPNYRLLSDSEYDIIESEYKKLAEELGKSTSASDMVGFDESRASCRLVMQVVDRQKSITFKLLEN